MGFVDCRALSWLGGALLPCSATVFWVFPGLRGIRGAEAVTEPA